MKLHTLYKRAVNGKTNEWTIEIQGNCYRTISGYTDGQKTTTEWTCCEGKNIGRSNETTPEEQALKEAKAEWDKRIERGYFGNIANIDKFTTFKPMLANKWEDRMDKIVYPVYSQPKLDGIRCIVRKDGMWTRTGKPIISAPHIYEALKPLFEVSPTLIFDGELYADKFANDFNAICSLVKKTKPTSQDILESAAKIQYHVYDLPSFNTTFVERYQRLRNLLSSYHPSVVVVKTEQVDNMNDVSGYYEDYIAAGYEGQMIRLDSMYENKRSNSLLKHKSFVDEEYTIVGVEEGGGNLTGMVGALVFESKVGSSRFTASVNGGWDYLRELWADFGKNPKSLIGKEATIKYFNITPDGKPRFPKVTAIRDYE